MREQAQLLRISYPHLGAYEVDLVKLYPLPGEETTADYLAYLAIHHDNDPPTIGERIVLKWNERLQGGRGEVVDLVEEQDDTGPDSEWRTFKISIAVHEQSIDARDYPRLVGGLSLFYANVDHIDEAEAWLSGLEDAENVSQDTRFSQPLDAFMNFSVSGVSFEAGEALSVSSPVLCALGMTNQPQTLTRCLGKVVRCEARDERFIIAINFVSPPPELTQTLSDFTLKLQRIETEGEGGRDEI